MKNLSLLVLLFTTLTSCRSRTPQSTFNRPDFNECITLNKVGFMACNGIVKPIPANMIVPETTSDYFKARDYCEKREYGHFICLLYPEKCSINP